MKAFFVFLALISAASFIILIAGIIKSGKDSPLNFKEKEK